MNVNVISLLAFTIDIITADTTKEPYVKSIDKLDDDISSSDGTASGSRIFHQDINDSQDSSKEHVSQAIFRLPFSITRLAKSVNYGYDPFFSKDNFAPFERRNKPVTLIAFRRNHILPRAVIDDTKDNSLEIAEMQSPYNTVGQFWEDTFKNS